MKLNMLMLSVKNLCVLIKRNAWNLLKLEKKKTKPRSRALRSIRKLFSVFRFISFDGRKELLFGFICSLLTAWDREGREGRRERISRTYARHQVNPVRVDSHLIFSLSLRVVFVVFSSHRFCLGSLCDFFSLFFSSFNSTWCFINERIFSETIFALRSARFLTVHVSKFPILIRNSRHVEFNLLF